MKITTNRKAYYEYFVLENFDTGLILLGAEVKSISKIDDLANNLNVPNGVKVLVVKIQSRKAEAELRKAIFEEVNRSITV